MIHTFLWLQNSSAWREHHDQNEFQIASYLKGMVIHHCFLIADNRWQSIGLSSWSRQNFNVNVKSNMAILQPFPGGFVVAGRSLGQNLEFVAARSSLCRPGRQILSAPSMVARDWSLRLPPIEVLWLYKSSLYRTGFGLEPPRLSLTSPHSNFGRHCCRDYLLKRICCHISPVLISLAGGGNPREVHIQSRSGIEPWGYLSKDTPFHFCPRLFVHGLDSIFYWWDQNVKLNHISILTMLC